jgi:hypothetical protein
MWFSKPSARMGIGKEEIFLIVYPKLCKPVGLF